MKKLIAMLVTVLCTVPMIVAQETVNGIVVDKKGNPLPGVRIEIPGSSDWTVSDLDGTFSITPPYGSKKVQATYAGMNSRKVKLKDGMKIKMKEGNWWSQKPDEWNWFAEAIFALPDPPGGDVFNPAYGLMLGRVKNFGYYVKGVTNTFGMKAEDFFNSDPGFIDKKKSSYWSITGGGIVRLGCPIHLYLGVGYSEYKKYVRNMSGTWFDFPDNGKDYIHPDYLEYYDLEVKRFSIDLGFIIRIKRVSISLGTTTAGDIFNFDNFADSPRLCGNFGIGYSF